MEKIKYHPLVDCDSNGAEKVPMFFTLDESTAVNKNALYLAEIIPRHYRLCAKAPHTKAAYSAYTIHCPVCGQAMTAISGPVDTHKLALYICPKCR